MTYLCKDCSYRGNLRGQGGRCPACDSYNFARIASKEEAPKPGKWRIILLVALWAYLIGLIIWKLNH
jgi:hypothetical protein